MKRSLFINGFCRNGHRLNAKTLGESQQANRIARWCRVCNALRNKLKAFEKRASQPFVADKVAEGSGDNA